MKRIFYALVILCSLSSVDVKAQLTVIDTINFRPSYLNDSTQLIRKRNDHFIDAQGNFWIGFSDLGARKLTDTLWTEYNTSNSGIASNFVLDVSQSANNNMWFGTNAGVSVYDGTYWTNYNRANSGIISDTITVIEHSGNTHWIGTRKGLSKFDGTNFTNYNTTNSGLPADSIICLATTPSGKVWVGTKIGLAYFDGSSWTVYDSLHNNFGNYPIYDIKIDGNGVVWVATGTRGVFLLKNGIFINYFSYLNSFSCYYNFYSAVVYYMGRGNDGLIYFPLQYPEISICRANTQDTTLTYAPYQSFVSVGIRKPLFYDTRLYLPFETVSTTYSSAVDSEYFVYDISASVFMRKNIIKPFGQYSFGIYSDPHYHAATADLDVNQVFTKILNKGDMHWDPISQINYYAVPVCSGKQTVYTSAIWLGGLDQSGLLHTAAQTYRQSGAMDFYSGPLDTITAQSDSATRVNYDKLWKVDQWIINEFRLNFLNGNVSNGTYTIPEVILKWPANGSGNFAHDLAPYVDYDHDGMYNAYHGDYPLINGDQMIWWIFNDQGLHTETHGTPFGFEIHGKAYGYGCPNLTGIDTVFNYTTFYQWKIINRSSETYHDVYVGLWSDLDLGNASDDYIGCDVGNASFFAYNADSVDDGAAGYGLTPPIQNITVLNGPLANANDGIDNDHDSIVDESDETIDLSSFLSECGIGICDNPQVSDDYYEYLTSRWLNGTHVTYGSDGMSGSFLCNFMYPGNTDPAFPGQNWTMADYLPSGDDVRGVGSSGPFTIAPGETRTIDFAYITTRDPNTQISLATNQLYTSYIRNWFKNGAIHPCPHDSFTYIPPVSDTSSAIIYPNPAIDFLLINVPQGFTNQKIIVYDVEARVCMDKIRDGNKIDISKLSAGIYFLKIVTQEKTYVARFVKMRK